MRIVRIEQMFDFLLLFKPLFAIMSVGYRRWKTPVFLWMADGELSPSEGIVSLLLKPAKAEYLKGG